MVCKDCHALPELPQKHAYLVTLANSMGQIHKIIVQTSCIHDMQEWVDAQTFPISNPRVIDIDAKSVSHVPLRDLKFRSGV
jgi:hypothetical protein